MSSSSHRQFSLTASVADLLRLLSRDLYREPEIFLRELVCNAFDATQHRGLTAANAPLPVIVLATNEKNRVSVADRGIGMDEVELHEFLSCIGRSGTRLASRQEGPISIGQFGLGFLSVLAVADQVTVQTLRSGVSDAVPWEWRWSGGEHYSLTRGSRAEGGTTVEVVLKPEFLRFANREFLRQQVRRHVPYLRYPVSVAPAGDPRDPAPWSRSLPPDRREQLLLALSTSAIHSFTCEDPSVHAAAAISFPKSVLLEPGCVRLYNAGVLVSDNAPALAPARWSWTRSIVNMQLQDLTISRDQLRAGSASWNAVRGFLVDTIAAEVLRLARAQPEKFVELVAAHREEFAQWLRDDAGARESIGESYPFDTTLGALQFRAIAARAASGNERRVIRYLVVAPEADLRWSIAKASGALLVRCRNGAEVDLLKLITAQVPGLTMEQLTWGAPQGRSREAPLLSPAMESFVKRMRYALSDASIHVEPTTFSPNTIPALIEFDGWSADARRADDSAPGLATAIATVADSLLGSAADSGRYRRLFLNMDNQAVRQLSERDAGSSTDRLVSALLALSGAIRGGLAIPESFLETVDRVTAVALTSTGSRTQEQRTESLHAVAFFAHDFTEDRDVLRCLRRVLEHGSFQWEVRSGDEFSEDALLYPSLRRQIASSDITIGELTHGNWNAFLEVGMALILLPELHTVLMHDRAAWEAPANLKGHLRFAYDRSLLETDQFALEVQKFFEAHPALRSIRKPRPFLGFRLLEEQRILTQEQRLRIGSDFPDTMKFLAESAAALARHYRVPQLILETAQQYFNGRVASHRETASAYAQG